MPLVNTRSRVANFADGCLIARRAGHATGLGLRAAASRAGETSIVTI
jgi:hypothetical protein